ncbi:cytochrome P450 [Diaporthe sp. PMI_573]|nr:cytochrome P450 [Diaporthaceae sp. PMI_573]
MAISDIDLPLHLILTAVTSYIIAITIYRLYLHPLAKFPGPKICAVTSLFELWWDFVGQGAYLYRIEKMHSIYGPIVRINPSELSIQDAQYYDRLYVTGAVRKTDCWPGNGGMDFKDSHGTTIYHDIHRLRRKPMEPYFSRKGVFRMEPVLKRLITTMVHRLDSFRGTGSVVRLDHVFSAFSSDVITAICVGYNESTSLKHSNFDPQWYDLFHEAIYMTPLFRSFPILPKILACLPKRLLEAMNPALNRLNDWREMAENHITKVKAQQATSDNSICSESSTRTRYSTLFQELVSSDSGLPESERSIQRLTTEAQVLLGAGTVTTTRTLTYLATHILLDDRVKKRLQEELRDPMAGFPERVPSLTELERLPYLRACNQEGLRLSFGFMVRLARCSPSVELRYKDWTIPTGTPVGMSAYFMHTDPIVFDQPLQFRPERWLEGQVTPEMQRNYVPFSKGSRACLGASLAYAELTMAIAALFRPQGPQLRLFETNATDVDPVRAYLLPMPKIRNNGARVVIE